jgi:hypothetical protein
MLNDGSKRPPPAAVAVLVDNTSLEPSLSDMALITGDLNGFVESRDTEDPLCF